MLPILRTLRSCLDTILYVLSILLLNTWLDEQRCESPTTKGHTIGTAEKVEFPQHMHSLQDSLDGCSEDQSDTYIFEDDVYFSAKETITHIISPLTTIASSQSPLADLPVQSWSRNNGALREVAGEYVRLVKDVTLGGTSWYHTLLASLYAIRKPKPLWILQLDIQEDDFIVQICKDRISEILSRSTVNQKRIANPRCFDYQSSGYSHAPSVRWGNSQENQTAHQNKLAIDQSATAGMKGRAREIRPSSEEGTEIFQQNKTRPAIHPTARGTFGCQVGQLGLPITEDSSGSSSVVIVALLLPELREMVSSNDS